MADHAKDKPAKPRLQSLPGWTEDDSARALPSKAPAAKPQPTKPVPPHTQRLKPAAATFKWPTLPRFNKKILTGSAAALAALSLSIIFAKYVANGNDADSKPLAQTPIAAAPSHKAPAVTAQTSAATDATKKQEKFSTLANLPQPGNTADSDIARLMQASKLPRDVIEEALHIYNHATPDGYRGRADDKLEIVYSQGLDVLFARVHANGNIQNIYGFEDRFGNFGFYSEDGHRIDRTGMSSPLKNNDVHNPKLTRVFEKYRHPIHKVTRHHSGIDFPAARGTPVYAIADGIVEYAKRRSGYGNTVTLNHSGNMQSLYAHLDGFAEIKAGRRIQQGELIGYVGSTGWSTGPHLHFEIRKNGTPVNPRTITAFSAPTISLQDRPEFSRALTRIKNHLSEESPAPSSILTAQTVAQEPPLTETFKDLFHRPGDNKIKALIVEAAHRDGIHPDLPYRLFLKEAGVNHEGALKTAALSDTGAAGLCQFTEQTFLYVMKSHGERLGMGEYAQKIRSYIGDDKATYYTADAQTQRILSLRNDKHIAIPLCTAYMRDNINHLKTKLGRTPNFTDVSIAHFFGPGVAADIIPAYDNPRLRKQHAYKFARSEALIGETNQSVFFEGGNRRKPYTVEQVYQMKREKMGTEPALITDIKRDRNSDMASLQPR